jgi:hypothetical protein
MTQETPVGKNLVQEYIKACGYGVNSPASLVRPPVRKTGNVVQNYLAAAGYGLPKKPEV